MSAAVVAAPVVVPNLRSAAVAVFPTVVPAMATVVLLVAANLATVVPWGALSFSPVAEVPNLRTILPAVDWTMTTPLVGS